LSYAEKKLIKISENEYQAEDGITYKKNFNQLLLPLKDVQLVNRFQTHDLDTGTNFDIGEGIFEDDADIDSAERLNKCISVEVGSNQSLDAIVNASELDKNLYYVREEDNESGTHPLEKVTGPIIFRLRQRSGFSGGRYNKGVFLGSCCFIEGELSFDLYTSSEQFNEIIANLKEYPSSELSAFVVIQSFDVSYTEDLFVDDSINTTFLVTWINETYLNTTTKQNVNFNPDDMTPEDQRHLDLIDVLNNMSAVSKNSFKQITRAIWVMIIIFVLTTLFFT